MEIKYYSKTIEETFSELKSSNHGLSSDEAKKRLDLYGYNELPEVEREGYSRIFFRQFKSPLIYLLLISGAIVWAMGEVVDAAVIFFVLFFNAMVGTIQEGKAQNTFLALRNLIKGRAAVLRDGEEVDILDRELVPGDVIILREGEKVPADSRIIQAYSLSVNESALTGESIPKYKNSDVLGSERGELTDQSNMVFKGTIVSGGSGRAIVAATGVETYLGDIAQEALTVGAEFPLKNDIQKLSRFIIIFVACIALVIFSLSLASGISYREAFKTVVAVSVSVIPEGLPIVMTLVLARGVWRMGKHNVLVKKLQAVEVLGETKIIAVDKTGTVTKNELLAKELYCGGQIFSMGGLGYEPSGEISLEGKKVDPFSHPELILAGKIAALGGAASLIFQKKTDAWKLAGDPTEGALLVFSRKVGLDRGDLLSEWPLIQELPFDYEVKFRASLHKVGQKNFLAVVGSPESILEMSGWEKYALKNKKLAAKNRKKIIETIDSFSAKGMRVVAFAYAETGKIDIQKHAMPSLVFGGLFGIRDELRPEVKEAVRKVELSGIRVVMITGDHELTATTIAMEAGIYKSGDSVLGGERIEKMNDEELRGAVNGCSVFARVNPKHKLRIIKAYQDNGIVIAMTGDGVNDALSLTAADIGIGMGKTGTETAKEASDIIFMDDNFENITFGVEEGRHIIKTIKKVVLYLLSTSLGEIFVIIGALLLGMPLPILAVQILWLNLVTDGFLDLGLAMESKSENESQYLRTYSKKRALLDGVMLQRMFLMALPMMAGTLFLFDVFSRGQSEKALTVSLTTLAAFQWFNAWNCRSSNHSIIRRGFFSNRYLIGATAIVVSLQFVAIYHPFFQRFLKTVALDRSDWLLIILVSFSIVVIEEARKFFVRWLLSRRTQQCDSQSGLNTKIMTMKKDSERKIIFTGGGTTGHVSLNLALIPLFLRERWKVAYIGSRQGIENRLVGKIANVQYFSVSTGKLRRYFSWQNFRDCFLIIAGIWQAFWIIRKQKAAVIFSKGGFVSFPVIVGGWLNGVPILMHESDMTPGLANRLSMPFASTILTTFQETRIVASGKKIQHIGPIIREELENGSPQRGFEFTGLNNRKPVMLVIGGSSGARKINQAIRADLDALLADFQVVHICGKGQLESGIAKGGYVQFEYLDKEYADLLAMSDIVVSRAGSNSIFELLYLQKPMVLVPLPLESSRGDQIDNADYLLKKGYCEVIQDKESGKAGVLLSAVRTVWKSRQEYVDRMRTAGIKNDRASLVEMIKNIAKR